MDNADLLQLSATQIVAKIRNREITPLQAVQAHIDRIKLVNPHINAVVTPMFDLAIAQAKDKTEFIEANGTDNLPPLFGLPMTIKDCWAVAGIRFTGGSWHHRDNVAAFSAEAVRLLQEAGAIILGKTNLPDMCWSGETVNPIFGQTNNPHHFDHTAGGSSGGEGAIIAAGGSPLGIGSDIAGSVRIPAAANGCVSLKPSAGRIPSEDHVPTPPAEILSWNTAGPLARRIEDLDLALRVLSRTPVQDYRQIDLKGRSCTVYIENGQIPVAPEVVETINIAMKTLESAGMNTVRNDDLPMSDALYTYCGIFTKHGNPEFKAALGNGKPYNVLGEIGRNLVNAGRISPRVLFHTFTIDFVGWEAKRMGLNTFEKLSEVKQKFVSAIGDGGVLLLPLFITPPPKHGWTWNVRNNPVYSLMFNAMGLPGVIVPIHYNTDKGLPMAVQIIANEGDDETALAVAAELERVHDGWKMATVV